MWCFAHLRFYRSLTCHFFPELPLTQLIKKFCHRMIPGAIAQFSKNHDFPFGVNFGARLPLWGNSYFGKGCEGKILPSIVSKCSYGSGLSNGTTYILVCPYMAGEVPIKPVSSLRGVKRRILGRDVGPNQKFCPNMYLKCTADLRASNGIQQHATK